jgi:TIR domain
MVDQEQRGYEFDIAVSFAGENRDYVSEVVKAVKGDVRVFYDEDYEAESWGEDGIEYFTNVYMNRAQYVLMFVSRQYAEKMWTKVERRSALARAATQRSAYVLPVRLDDTQLEGLLPTVIYLDSRRLGIEELASAIRAKVAGAAPAKPTGTLLDGKVPKSQEAIEALMTERTGLWEYLLYGGLLKLNMDKLEPKYRDFAMGYARRNGRYLAREELSDFVHSTMASMEAIVENFNAVLGAEVQERAFGAPGDPGDVDRIIHMATRFVAVYEDFMDWAGDLRGTSARVGAEALRALARYAQQPVESCRRFTSDFVAELDTISERVEAGEHVRINAVVTLDVDPAIAQEFQEKLRQALEDDV